jgi:hypothetical protein
LLDKLRPNRQLVNTIEAGRLRKVLPNGDIREIRAIINSGAVFNARSDGEWDEYAISETVQFIAHDPIVYDPVQQSETWVIGGITNTELTFPITFPIEFGISNFINSSVNVTYVGTWLSYPTITITGPLYEPEIHNTSTGESLYIDYEIPDGSTLVIDLTYGQKTVVLDGTTNLVGTVTTNSDLATFHIAPDPEVSGGTNTLQVIGSNGSANTAVVVSWYNNYIGI